MKRSIHFSVRDLSLMHHNAIRTGQARFKRSYVSHSRGLCLQDDRNHVKQTYYKMTHINPTPFDTLTMVKDLEKSGTYYFIVMQQVFNRCSTGFTAEQAEALVGVLVGVATHSNEQALSGHVSHQTLVGHTHIHVTSTSVHVRTYLYNVMVLSGGHLPAPLESGLSPLELLNSSIPKYITTHCPPYSCTNLYMPPPL